MRRALWRALPGEAMVSEAAPALRLVVTKVEAPRSVRFVVEDHAMGGCPGGLVLSGYRDSVAAAMEAAEERTARIGGG